MKLEKQVCSLELAKRLKELGVKQESLFWWNISDGIVIGEQYRRPPSISAFTVAELGEMLPGNTGALRFQHQKGLLGNMWFSSPDYA